MTSSFQKLWEKVSQEDSETPENKSMDAIRNGIGIRDGFWDDFLLLLNNAEALADLLQVPVEKIGTWYETIKNNIDMVQKADGKSIPKERKKLLKTGLPEEL